MLTEHVDVHFIISEQKQKQPLSLIDTTTIKKILIFFMASGFFLTHQLFDLHNFLVSWLNVEASDFWYKRKKNSKKNSRLRVEP